MKFNVKVPGSNPDEGKNSADAEPTEARGEDSGPVLKRKPVITIPKADAPSQAETRTIATYAEPTDDDGEYEAEVEDVYVDDYEVDAEDEAGDDEPFMGVDRSSLLEDDDFNPLLDDDESEDFSATARSEAAATVEDDEWNPLLDDEDEDDAEAFTGFRDRLRGGKTAEPTPEPVVKPAAKAARKPVVEVEEVEVRMPARPELSPKDRDNLQKKAERAAAKEAELASKTPRKKALKSGYEPKTTYEVTVDRSGRERTKVVEEASAGDEPGEKQAKTFRVVNEDGTERWEARRAEGAEKGKLEATDLKVFTNLNRKKRDVLQDLEVKDAFARGRRGGESRADKTKRDRLANRAIFGDEQLQAGSRKRFTEKDRDTLRFIGMFKYANARHIARIFQVNEATMTKRLQALEKRGLLQKKDIYGARPLWYLTEGGLVCSGLEVPRVKESGITYTMLPHQFVINHTAGNLWGGGVNVLNLEDFPGKHRQKENGEFVVGEELVSELEIQSSFSQIKVNHKADTYRPIVTEERDKQFRLWKQAGGLDFGPSPEQVPGNEYMWTLIPPMSLRLAYHVPDLVVKRPRNADGTPASIAVEIELANKPYQAYERALQAYRFDSLLYGQVIWVVKSRGAARKLEEAARKVGLWDNERVDIVPILTEDGIFKNRAEWTL